VRRSQRRVRRLGFRSGAFFSADRRPSASGPAGW
jgi:hypothetical protein